MSSDCTILRYVAEQKESMDADIDRRITVLSGTQQQQQTLRRISDLREVPFYVLLGEPGIGKTSTFMREAEAEGGAQLTVRQLLNGFPAPPGATLFLDGLDEYRIDGQASDKVTRLAGALLGAKPPRWRLACRSEDWRAEADMAQIQLTTLGSSIVVIQLQPLEDDEQTAILSSLGEAEPHRFLEQARLFNASAFCESPLSLGLLYKTVTATNGMWPETRRELFARSIERLAYEQNPEYKSNPRRSSPDEIIRAAGSAFLLMLASGTRVFWRSNGEPPATNDAHAYLSAHDLSMDLNLLQDMLDTALFKGEGEMFEPMHRTIAEYLAAETLAKAVGGGPGVAALPLARALALIAGFDGRAPTELRGLFAWMAVHLMLLGDESGARQVVEADPVTILGYGDAASLSTPIRRAILENLGRDDPYFRASEVGATYVASLAGEDLAAELRAVLNDRTSVDHRMLTVTDALTSGTPVKSLRPVLREIVLDVTRPGWQRLRAFHAWHNGSASEPGSVQALFSELAAQPISIEREDLRINMAATFSSAELTLDVIKNVVADFHRCPEDNLIGRLSRLERRLEEEPPMSLFDEPSTNWLPTVDERHRAVEVEGFLDRTLTAVLKANLDLSAQQLVNVVGNASPSAWHAPKEEAQKQIRAWLEKTPEREIELFDVLLARAFPADKPYGVINEYITLTRRELSISVIRVMLARSRPEDANPAERHQTLAIAGVLARRDLCEKSYWEVYEELLKHPAERSLLEDLTIHQLQAGELDRAERRHKDLLAKLAHAASNLAILSPKRSRLESGNELGYLDWAARQYFSPQGHGPKTPASLDGVRTLTNESLANSIAIGWANVADNWPTGAIVSQIGAADAIHSGINGALAALAGLLQILKQTEDGGTMALPIGLAAVVFTSAHCARDDSERDRLEKWALKRIEHDSTAGSAFLASLWSATLGAGGLHLTGLHAIAERETLTAVLERTLDSLLRIYPAMPDQTLRECLKFAVTTINRERLKAMAAAALANSTVIEPQRTKWTLVAFALDPEPRYERLLTRWSSRNPSDLHDAGFWGNVLESLAQADAATAALSVSLIVRLFGPTCGPEDEHGRNRNSPDGQRSSSVRRAINLLTVDQTPRAQELLLAMSNEGPLAVWRPNLRHALAEQASTRRDRAFKHPDVAIIRRALAGGPPVNASDLRAIVENELRRMQAEMHTNENRAWRLYWDIQSKKPLVENDCRDRLLERLKDRLSIYLIAAALPEARRGEETRSDVLVLSGAGKNLPIEAKRHFHAEIWTAASTQLQGYTADVGADGYGVYLVFWFGNEATPTPARPDSTPGPTTAAEMERMLIADLTPELRAKTTVVTLDVADPKPPTTAKPRRKRTKKP